MRWLRWEAFGLLLLVMLSGPAWAAGEYSIVALGSLIGPGGFSEAFALNDAGQVVGQSLVLRDGYNIGTGFLWQRGVGMTDLGSINGQESQANGINGRGEVVGYCGGNQWRAFRWDQVSGLQEYALPSGGSSNAVFAMNDAGQAVGWADVGGAKAYLWETPSVMVRLVGMTDAYSINSAGQVAGVGPAAFADGHAYLWTAAAGARDLGTLPGGYYRSRAWDVNDLGFVVGSSATSGGSGHAVLWDTTGRIADLGTLPDHSHSEARAINNLGSVVGSSDYSRAFVWDQARGMRDLNSLLDASGSGWTLMAATDINNHGQIVGYGTGPQGLCAFLATPVPEVPSGITVLLSVVSAIMLMRRRA